MMNKFYGNKTALALLESAVKSGRQNHAYLIQGEFGMGKRTFARIFAKAVLCENFGDEIFGCGICKSCVKANGNVHPDIIDIGGNTDGKNSLHAETVRIMRGEAYIRPNESRYKIYIIHKAENMSIAAANSILKLIEEPPRHAIFMLLSENPMSLPDTIRSRCMNVALNPVSADEFQDALTEMGYSKEEIKTAAESCFGNIGRAVSLLKDTSGEVSAGSNDLQMQIVRDVSKSLENKDRFGFIKAFSEIDTDRKSSAEVIEKLIMLIRDAIAVKNNSRAIFSLKDEAAKLAESFTLKNLFLMVEHLEYSLECLGNNGHPGLVINCLSASMI